MRIGTKVKCKSRFVSMRYNEVGEVVAVNDSICKVFFDKDEGIARRDIDSVSYIIDKLNNAYWFFARELEEVN